VDIDLSLPGRQSAARGARTLHASAPVAAMKVPWTIEGTICGPSIVHVSHLSEGPIQLLLAVWIALIEVETLTVGAVVPPWKLRVHETLAVMALVLDGGVATSGIDAA
jgi:hypothetical protein